jgi:hypothetical protein
MFFDIGIAMPTFFWQADRLLAANKGGGFNKNTHKVTAFQLAANKIQADFNTFEIEEVLSGTQRFKPPFKVEPYCSQAELKDSLFSSTSNFPLCRPLSLVSLESSEEAQCRHPDVESLVLAVVALDLLQATDVMQWPIRPWTVGVTHDDTGLIICPKLMLEVQKSKGKIIFFLPSRLQQKK